MSGSQDLITGMETFPEIRLAIVFGSVARQTARKSSDLDIAVLCDLPLSSELKMAIVSALARAAGRPVDLIDLKRVGEPLLGEILKNGKRIVVRDPNAYAALLSRHLFDVADFLPYRQRILAERRAKWIAK